MFENITLISIHLFFDGVMAWVNLSCATVIWSLFNCTVLTCYYTSEINVKCTGFYFCTKGYYTMGLITCMMFRWRHFHFWTNAFSCEGKMQILRIWHQRSEDATGKMWKQKDMQNKYCRSTITLLPSHLYPIEIFYNFMEVMDTLALCRYKYDDHRIRKIIKK